MEGLYCLDVHYYEMRQQKHSEFVSLMKRAPKTILTDQDKCITEAILKEMPSTKHAFCIWHITTKFSSWFNSTLRSDYSNWCSEFYNLYKLDTIEEFEQQWPRVIEKYKLEENKHILGLYRVKTFWVPAYLREFFFGGMTTTGRSESINAFIKRFLSSNTCLLQFIRQVNYAIEDIEQTQMHDTMLEKYRGAYLRSQSPLEEQAHRFFFISVFLHKDCFNIPITYWPSRWSRKGVSLSPEPSIEDLAHPNSDERVIDLIQCPPISKTKGRPKDNSRMKGGKELTKQVRRCKICRTVGHYFTTCPNKEHLAGANEIVSKHATKKQKNVVEDEDLNPIFSYKY
ncbi:protein FAR1-RELATED SEQUENCE 11-like [Rutidosis leptorrhynchoides]|uniref:protein FAR1-RELATED SEQUENCE 11-like n=1 Tax=Rutidosis leptorrhynchoides TaxID=125765 RepID=UPI003A995F0C